MNKEKWAIFGVVFTVLGAIAAILVVPEFRKATGLDTQPPNSTAPIIPAHTPTPEQFNPLTQEAQNEARRYLQSKFTKCGDSYYCQIPGQVIEHKNLDVRVQMNTTPISEAERLNGMEWKGEIIAIVTTTRFHYVSGGSSAWIDGWDGDHRPTKRNQMLKRNGTWIIEDDRDASNALRIFQPISCADIPQ